MPINSIRENCDDIVAVSEIELVYKSVINPTNKPQIVSSADIYNIVRPTWDENKIELIEQFKVLYLNKANRVLALYNLSSGGITGTIADPRLIYAAALKLNACSIVVCHNHPSGNLLPSRSDEIVTQKIKAVGEVHDIRLLDHLIITRDLYYSFSDMGFL